MKVTALPRGLRHVLVHVTLESDFPPPRDSAEDIGLVRAANRAMQREANGISDSFLFLFVGRHDWNRVSRAVADYGFPNAEVRCIEAYESQQRLDMGEGDLTAEVTDAIETWMNSQHLGAVARFPTEYGGLDFWWSGVEHDDDVFDWPFSEADFAKTLPGTQRSRAATWLSILGHAVELNDIQATSPDLFARESAAAWAVTLCEWLHGFEAASGNGFNSFEEELTSAITPSDFYLAFQLARLSGKDLESLCEEHDADVDGLKHLAVSEITGERVYAMRDALSDFFGGDGLLFWALYSSVWPEFGKQMEEALDDSLGSIEPDTIAELDAPWRFVSEGWCDEADSA